METRYSFPQSSRSINTTCNTTIIRAPPIDAPPFTMNFLASQKLSVFTFPFAFIVRQIHSRPQDKFSGSWSTGYPTLWEVEQNLDRDASLAFYAMHYTLDDQNETGEREYRVSREETSFSRLTRGPCEECLISDFIRDVRMYLWKVTGEREREERLPRKSRYQTRRQFCFGIYNSCQEFAKIYIYIYTRV